MRPPATVSEPGAARLRLEKPKACFPKCVFNMSNKVQLQRRLDVVASSIIKSIAAPTQAPIGSQQSFPEVKSDRLKLGSHTSTSFKPNTSPTSVFSPEYQASKARV